MPCVTLRENTERPATIECGTNILGGTESGRIRKAIREQLQKSHRWSVPELWDGRAASRIVGILAERLCRVHAPEFPAEPTVLTASAGAGGQTYENTR